MVTEAVKYDGGKPRFDLIPAEPLVEVAKVFTMGAAKYGDRNWEMGMEWSRVFSAMQRHLWAFWAGENLDQESGLHHLAHAAFGCLALIWYALYNIGTDDRPKRCCQCMDCKDQRGEPLPEPDETSICFGIPFDNDRSHIPKEIPNGKNTDTGSREGCKD